MTQVHADKEPAIVPACSLATLRVPRRVLSRRAIFQIVAHGRASLPDKPGVATPRRASVPPSLCFLAEPFSG